MNHGSVTRPQTAPGRWAATLAPVVVVGLCLLPLLVTPVLPSVDFYAHIVRYAVLADPTAPGVAENYTPHWQLLPNLGMDILATGIMRVTPTMLGARILAAIVILAPVLGAMALARAVHGRLDPLNAALAGLLGYNLILFWGFANFLLGFGIALWSLSWWITTRDRPRLQLATMAAIGIVILFIHGLVFALWGLLLGAVELMLAVRAGDTRPRALARRAGRLLLLAVIPVLLFLRMSTAAPENGVTVALSNLGAHAADGNLWPRLWEELLKRIDSILRVAEISATPLGLGWADRLFGLVLWGGLAVGILRGWFGLHPRLWLAAALAGGLIVAMPPNLLGVGHLDERMPLVFFALLGAGLALRPGAADHPGAARLRLVLIVLFPLHIALSVAALSQTGRAYAGFLDTVRSADIGQTAVAAYPDGTYPRDAGLFCKPLLFLLHIERGTAVPTFANPTQQPLRLAGPLAAASAAVGPLARDTPRDEMLTRLAGAGFDTIVACERDSTQPPPDGLTVIGRGPGWALYQPR